MKSASASSSPFRRDRSAWSAIPAVPLSSTNRATASGCRNANPNASLAPIEYPKTVAGRERAPESWSSASSHDVASVAEPCPGRFERRCLGKEPAAAYARSRAKPCNTSVLKAALPSPRRRPTARSGAARTLAARSVRASTSLRPPAGRLQRCSQGSSIGHADEFGTTETGCAFQVESMRGWRTAPRISPCAPRWAGTRRCRRRRCSRRAPSAGAVAGPRQPARRDRAAGRDRPTSARVRRAGHGRGSRGAGDDPVDAVQSAVDQHATAGAARKRRRRERACCSPRTRASAASAASRATNGSPHGASPNAVSSAPRARRSARSNRAPNGPCARACAASARQIAGASPERIADARSAGSIGSLRARARGKSSPACSSHDCTTLELIPPPDAHHHLWPQRTRPRLPDGGSSRRAPRRDRFRRRRPPAPRSQARATAPARRPADRLAHRAGRRRSRRAGAPRAR